jgi:ATP-dependent Clp protease ATP-binding subunit ClpA
MDAVAHHFRPEFINRIDEVVVFDPLGREQIAGIADIQLGRLRKRLAERELSLELSQEAMDKLIAVGYDPVYGARPLKRAIQRWIENPLAQQILGSVRAGQQRQGSGRGRADRFRLSNAVACGGGAIPAGHAKRRSVFTELQGERKVL